ncbi:MAG: LemA family protein [Verrucomicrobiaceae bacterium]|nr:LemA family protein [Verrucomicrobiaceae bacterium]
MKASLVLIGILVVLALAGVSSYNGLVSSNQGVNAAWAQVENVYQRRADLIPNLVKTVEGAANFEKSTLTDITEARASVGKVQLNNAPQDAEQLAQFEKAQGALGGALGRLMVIVEKYPDLKANAGFQSLQAQLEGTENRISVERGRFNEVVQTFNTKIKSVPGVFFAGALGFTERPYFKAKEGSEEPPKVDFNFGGGSKAQP